MSFVSNVVKYACKYTAPKVKDISKLQYVTPVTKDAGLKIVRPIKEVAASTEKSLSGLTQAFREKLDLYNTCKLLKSEGFNTGTRIINRWKPEYGIQINGVYRNAIEELNQSGAIDRYIGQRFPTIKSKADIEYIKGILNKYLEKNLDIYTYQRISKILSGFHPEIAQKLKNGAIIYMPNKEKSYNLITQMYKEINPDAKIIEGYKNLKTFLQDKKGVEIIVLDDCLVSGKSAAGLHKNIFLDIPGGKEKVKSVDMYVLTASSDGLNKVPKEIKVHYDSLKHSLTKSDYFKNELQPEEKNILLAALGSSDLKYNQYCAVMFPYMSPNNNSLFSAHMIRELFSGPECAIKGIFSPTEIDVLRSEAIKRALQPAAAAV